MAKATLSDVFEKLWQAVKADNQAKLTEAKSYTDTKTSGELPSSRLPVVPITKGGTGATSAANARTNLGVTPTNIGAVNKSGDTMTGPYQVTTLNIGGGALLSYNSTLNANEISFN